MAVGWEGSKVWKQLRCLRAVLGWRATKHVDVPFECRPYVRLKWRPDPPCPTTRQGFIPKRQNVPNSSPLGTSFVRLSARAETNRMGRHCKKAFWKVHGTRRRDRGKASGSAMRSSLSRRSILRLDTRRSLKLWLKGNRPRAWVRRNPASKLVQALSNGPSKAKSHKLGSPRLPPTGPHLHY